MSPATRAVWDALLVCEVDDLDPAERECLKREEQYDPEGECPADVDDVADDAAA